MTRTNKEAAPVPTHGGVPRGETGAGQDAPPPPPEGTAGGDAAGTPAEPDKPYADVKEMKTAIEPLIPDESVALIPELRRAKTFNEVQTMLVKLHRGPLLTLLKALGLKLIGNENQRLGMAKLCEKAGKELLRQPQVQ